METLKRPELEYINLFSNIHHIVQSKKSDFFGFLRFLQKKKPDVTHTQSKTETAVTIYIGVVRIFIVPNLACTNELRFRYVNLTIRSQHQLNFCGNNNKSYHDSIIE